MATHTQRSINVLNHLIQINHHRMQRLEMGANATSDEVLRKLLRACCKTSEQCNKDLYVELNRLGTEPVLPDHFCTLMSAWVAVENELQSKDSNPPVSCCVCSEEMVKAAHANVLKEEAIYLSPSQSTAIEKHLYALNASSNAVKTRSYFAGVFY